MCPRFRRKPPLPRAPRFFAVAALASWGVLLTPSVAATVGSFGYVHAGGAAVVGDTDEVSVRLSNEFDLRAWSVGVCLDPLQLEVVDVVRGAAVPLDPEFEEIVLWPGGWTAVVILSSTGAVVLPAGSSQEIQRATYRPLEAGMLPVDFCDSLGDPPVENRVVDSRGNEFVPGFFTTPFASFESCLPYSYLAPTQEVAYDPEVGNVTFEAGVQIVECSEYGPSETEGFSMGLSHDPDVLAVLEVEAAEFLQEINDGAGPDFFAINLFPDGWTAGVVYTFCCVVLEFPEPVKVLIARYEASGLPGGDGAPPTVTALVWSEDLGIPPVANVVVVGGQSRPAAGEDGVVILIPQGDTEFRRGDCNDDGPVDIADGIFLIQALFLGGESPHCAEACDANGDGFLDSSDATYIFNYRFLDGLPPPAPFPDCGPAEPEECEEFNNCP